MEDKNFLQTVNGTFWLCDVPMQIMSLLVPVYRKTRMQTLPPLTPRH